jgi:hypothetical protein
MTNDNAISTPKQAVASLEAAQASAPDHYRDLAEDLLGSGEITGNSTIADAQAAMKRRYPPQE